VRRADFDALILQRARELGAVVAEEATVNEPLLDGDRVSSVRYTVRGGPTREIRAKLVVDVSGLGRVIGRSLTALARTTPSASRLLREMEVWPSGIARPVA
jgi:flavin-dependent dehydrogenase